MANKEQMCTVCGGTKTASDFYASSSPFHKHIKRLHVCKKCLWDHVDADNNENIDINVVIDALRRIDKPFLLDLWESSIVEAERDNKSIFKIYMKNLGMHQYRNLTWDDSDFEGFEKAPSAISGNKSNNKTFDEEVKKRWIGYTDPKQIAFLENFYQELVTTYESKTPMQRNIYKNIAETQLLANQARAEGKVKEFQDLMKTMSILMNDGKIKPLQDNGEEDGSLTTWGQWIKKIEETEPIPEPVDEFKDVDGIRKYINKWFTSHFAKVFGVADANKVSVDTTEKSNGDNNDTK